MDFLPTTEFWLGNLKRTLVYLELQPDQSSYKTNRSKTNYNVNLSVRSEDEERLLALNKSGSYLLPVYLALSQLVKTVINSGKWTEWKGVEETCLTFAQRQWESLTSPFFTCACLQQTWSHVSWRWNHQLVPTWISESLTAWKEASLENL